MGKNVQDHPYDSFEQQFRENWPSELWNDVSLLVAVSGGSDSVALLRAVKVLQSQHESARGRIEAAHFNHGWRSDASDEDEAFVRSLCASLQIRCHCGRSEHSAQKEQVARDERYDFLRKIAEQRGNRYLLLAHTANDQAETVLHRIVRGTGLKGLRGIPPRRRLSEAVTIVRPMIWAGRSDVLQYLSRLGQNYRNDASNSDPRFTRNRIRHELLPHLAQHYNPAIIDSLLRLSSLAAEADQEISELVVSELATCVVAQNEHKVELDRPELMSCSPFLQREILAKLWRQQGWPEQSMGFEQWHQLVVAIAEQRTINVSGQIHVESTPSKVQLERPRQLREGEA